MNLAQYISIRAYIACAKLTFMSSPFLSANVSPPSSVPPTSSEILNFQYFPQLNTHAQIRKGFHKFCWILLWELENWKHFNHDFSIDVLWNLNSVRWIGYQKGKIPKSHVLLESDENFTSQFVVQVTHEWEVQKKVSDGRKFKSRCSNNFATQFCLLKEKSMLNFETWVEVILLNSFMVHIAFKLFKVLHKRRINSVRVTRS